MVNRAAVVNKAPTDEAKLLLAHLAGHLTPDALLESLSTGQPCAIILSTEGGGLALTASGSDIFPRIFRGPE